MDIMGTCSIVEMNPRPFGTAFQHASALTSSPVTKMQIGACDSDIQGAFIAPRKQVQRGRAASFLVTAKWQVVEIYSTASAAIWSVTALSMPGSSQTQT